MTNEAPEDELVEPPHDAADGDDADGDAPAGELTNGTLARIFHDIGDMLEVKGEVKFKTIAYHRAADTIGRSPIDLVAAYRSGNPPKVPGVGAAISDKIAELAALGDPLQVLEVRHTQFDVHLADGLRPKSRDAEDLDEGRRDL